ncbi:hypothetical protein HPB47_021515 [Ixodes persulcatus]|uniref:Uncharacterized protein n=1 Tax=Ixodes persulcatus TaxID=34615 RepID=A0AC60QET6_IXOPE|nr:hypothetical protein HPB47_021515 [Ixodes persulcatus]
MINLPEKLKNIPKVEHTIYADDITIWCKSGSHGQVEERLQATADITAEYARSRGLQCTQEKSELLVMRNPREGLITHINVKMDEQEVPKPQEVRILGQLIPLGRNNKSTLDKLTKATVRINGMLRRIRNKQHGLKGALKRSPSRALLDGKAAGKDVRQPITNVPNLPPLEVEILRRTADISSISYDATPTRDTDASNATDSDDKCVCCRDYPAAVRKQQDRQSCVTSHPDFEALCLTPGVLQLALLNMRHYGERNMGATSNAFIADFLAELDIYARASRTLEAYMTERILPLAWQASARRWYLRGRNYNTVEDLVHVEQAMHEIILSSVDYRPLPPAAFAPEPSCAWVPPACVDQEQTTQIRRPPEMDCANLAPHP